MIPVEQNTKFQQIRDRLCEMLVAENYRAGDRFPSENKLVTLFGVARMTINKVVLSLAEEGLLERIKGKGTFVTDRVDALRKHHGVDRDLVLALLICFDPTHLSEGLNASAQFVANVDELASELGIKVDVYNLQHLFAIPDKMFETLVGKGYDGLLLANFNIGNAEQEIRRLKKALDVPMVLGDGPSSLVDSVDFDQEWIGWAAADHLLALGHRAIAFLGYETDAPWMAERQAGFMRACRSDSRFKSREGILTLPGGLEEGSLRREMAKVFSSLIKKYSAVVCANDVIAAMLIEAVTKQGLSIPDALSVVGVDDFLECRSLNLTTFRRSGAVLAKSALELLQGSIRQPSSAPPIKILLKPKLMIRNSTAECEG